MFFSSQVINEKKEEEERRREEESEKMNSKRIIARCHPKNGTQKKDPGCHH